MGNEVLSCSFGDMAPGASAEVHITSPTTGATCGDVLNTATAQADNNPPVTTDQAIVTVNCPQIMISKTADGNIVSAGDTIGYVIRVDNGGPGTAYGVVVTDLLPTMPGLFWTIDDQNSDSGCDISGDPLTLTCTWGDIPAGGHKSVHITSPTTYATCGTIENRASVSTSNNGTDQTEVIPIVVQCPALEINKVAVDGIVSAGDPIAYDITVSNSGLGIAYGVTLNDALPVGDGIAWTVTSVTGGGGYSPPPDACSINGSLHCDFGDMPTGQSVTVRVTSPTVGAACTAYTNNASAQATNNPAVIDSATITVECPDLAITKVADSTVVRAGEQIGFLVTVTNNGPGTAHNVTISDPLPAHPGTSWSLDPAVTGCEVANNTLNCTGLGDLNPSGAITLHLVSSTTADSAGTYPNTATAQADNNEPVQASDTITVQALKVIVIVCTDDGYLYPSYVTVDGETKVSIGPPSPSELCGTGGATFEPKRTGDHPSNVAIPATPVP